MTCPRKHVNTRVVFTLYVLLLTACTSKSPTDPQYIGIVSTYYGIPVVLRNGQTYLLSTQSRIYQGDIIKNDETSRVDIQMIDDTQIILGPDTHFVFHQYDYEPGSFFPNARMTFTSGMLRARTENVTQAWFGSFEIQTPLALIRPENADFWVNLNPRDNSLDVTLLNGKQVQIDNDHGNVRIRQHQFGTSVRPGSAPRTPKRLSERVIDSIHQSSAPRREVQ